MSKKKQSFEESMVRLEQIVRAMERGDVALEESLKLFQEGTELVRSCQKLLDDAKAITEAGVFAIVLECVPSALAEMITKAVDVPTIGIGAGAGCDGQILVYQDMLGMFSDFTPKFVKRYANVGEAMKSAFKTYIQEVGEGVFPMAEHGYGISNEVIDKLY